MSNEGIEHGIIVADDSALIRDTVRSAFRPPWHVFPAANGVEALQYARSVLAAFVLLDVRMPLMDGLEACTRIRALPHYDSVPIIMLTAHDDIEVRRRALQAGATLVFPKPFALGELRASIMTLLTARRDAASPATAPQQFAANASERVPTDSAQLSRNRDVLGVHRRVETAIAPSHDDAQAEATAMLRGRSGR